MCIQHTFGVLHREHLSLPLHVQQYLPPKGDTIFITYIYSSFITYVSNIHHQEGKLKVVIYQNNHKVKLTCLNK